jgi:insulysin
MVEGVFMTRPLTAPEKVADRSLLLPSCTYRIPCVYCIPKLLKVAAASEHVWRLTVPDANNINSACEYYCQVGHVADDHLRPRLFLLARLAKAPVFDILRTKEQLGYVVFSSARTLAGSMGFRILLQSEKPSAFLEARVEAFLQHFKAVLEEMSDADFRMTKQGLISTYAESPKNLQEESSRYWNAIEDGDYDFDRRESQRQACCKVGLTSRCFRKP